MVDVSFKNRAVLDVMIGMCNEDGHAPTIRKLSERLGFKSPNSVMVHMKRLLGAGLVKQVGRGYVPVAWHERIKEAIALCDKKAVEEVASA
jgi:DNA-binding transcriptional ArsR family regulator